MNYLEETSFDEFAIHFGLLYKRWTTYIQVLQHIQYVKHRQSQRSFTRTFSLVINRDRWWLFCFLVHYCLYRLIRRQFQTDPGICYFHQTDQLAFKIPRSKLRLIRVWGAMRFIDPDLWTGLQQSFRNVPDHRSWPAIFSPDQQNIIHAGPVGIDLQ